MRTSPRLFNASTHLASDSLWSDDPKSAYGKFLQDADKEVKSLIEYNQRVLNALSQHPIESFTPPVIPEVSAQNGSFYDFKTCLNLHLYCSKITIRNVEMANFDFKFDADVISRILNMNVVCGKCPDFKIARRTIVPAVFSQSPQLAGPMGYHEYLIDGNNSRESTSVILFCANSEYPIKIILENCKGLVLVSGLEQDAINRIFTVVNCDKDFIFGNNYKINQSRPA